MQLANVPFYNDNLVLVNRNEEPYVPMRPIVEQMGLDWRSQHRKINERFNSVMVIMTTTGSDGKRYEMVCMPLRKLPAWLYSISPNRVAPELKEKIILYQEECDDVLWQYWTKGFAGKQKSTTSLAQSKYRIQLVKQLEKERNPVIREMIYEDLKIVSAEFGASVPEISKIGFENPHAELLQHFWEFYETTEGGINHAHDPALIAIHVTEALPLFEEYMGEKFGRALFAKTLASSQNPKFLRNTAVSSRIRKKSVRCYVFNAR